MKTGLVTFACAHRYEAALQAAALKQAVEALGCPCEILDCRGDGNGGLRGSPGARPALRSRALQTREQRFTAFARERLQATPCREASGMPRDPERSYGVLLWSGQIDPTLSAALAPCRQAACALSFGAPGTPEDPEEGFRDCLTRFSHLSAQEPRSRRILEKLTGQEVPATLDPTLLLTAEQWAVMASDRYFRDLKRRRSPLPRPASGGYILCYCAGRSGALEPYLRKFASLKGLPVIQLCGARRRVLPKARLLPDAGPAEFLALFFGASFVFTDTLLGTAFSILFHVPFLAAPASGTPGDPESARILALLDRLHLRGRFIGQGTAAGLEEEIDWAETEARLAEARSVSLGWLRAALENRAPEAREAAAEGPRKLPRLADGDRCTGCTACANACPRNAISMVRDREGFAYPEVDPEKCLRCGRCAAVCPALGERKAGHLPAAFAAWNRDARIRRDSTSGGVFTALAERILESGGVVYGAAMDSRQHLRHAACFRKEELHALRGAKYVQSDLGETFREIRESLKKRPVLFSGTPCQVDGLYRFLGERPENLTTCDLVCQGVPSPGVWEAMARSIEARKGKALRSVRFRNKVAGWEDSHFTAVYQDGTMDSAPLFATGYGHALSRALFLRPCCHRCAYANLNRPGDFTLGDFWGLRPDELPEQQLLGVSLLLVNTAHGSYLFDQLNLGRRAFPIERAVAGNPRLAYPLPPPPDRAAFFSAFALEPFEKVRRKYCSVPPLAVRLTGLALSPEARARFRGKLR